MSWSSRHRPPAPPSLGDLNHTPGAQWGYNPNAANPVGGMTGSQGGYAAAPIATGPARTGMAGPVTNDQRASSLGARAAANRRAAPSGAFPVASASVQGDVTGWQAAQTALQQMQDRASSGWSQLDRMALDQAQRQSGQYEQAQRGALMQDFAARGMRNSGTSMMAALGAQQGGADRALDAATNLGVAGRDRAMANTASAGALGMGMNDTQFGQNMARAQAVDAFNAMASGRSDAASLANYQMLMDRYGMMQQQRQNRINNIVGPIMGLASTGISLASGGFGGGGSGGGGGER